MGESIITPEFRGSFVNLVTPKAMAGSDKLKYGMLVVLDNESPETAKFIEKLTTIIHATMTEKFGKVLKSPKHWPILDGDEWNADKDEGDEKENAFAGKTLIRVSSNYKPEVVNMQGAPVVKEAEIYSGAWYRAYITPWGWSGEFGRGISISLDSVLKVKDDDRIGGGSRSGKKAFAAYFEDADDEDEAPAAKPKKKKVVEDDDEDEAPAPKAKAKKKSIIEDED